MASSSTMGVSLLFALVLVTAVTAREGPLGGEKTYAPPYGTDPTPSYSPPDVPSYSPPDVPMYSPPDTPVTPYTPDPSIPTPSTPGTCSWWSSNTSSFPDIISLISTLIDLFGTITGGSGATSSVTTGIASIFGSGMTVGDALSNTRPDGFGALARQGSAALLNSLTRRDYRFNSFQVKTQFRNSLGNQQQAYATARLFEEANIALGNRRF